MMDNQGVVCSAELRNSRIGRYRWFICGLIFAATVINYIDRQMIGVLKPTLQHEFGWTEITYGDIVFWFQAAYALGFLVFGRVVDRLGVRLGYALAMILWTAAHIAHSVARSAVSFMAVRFLLGIGESGNFPPGLKAFSRWVPQPEPTLAIGIFNAGSNIGAILTPFILPAITLALPSRP